MKKLIVVLTLLLTACIQPLPTCEGTEEQVYRCESLRMQKEQLRRTKAIQIQQNQQIWSDFHDKNVKKPYAY
mgnify:FL=1